MGLTLLGLTLFLEVELSLMVFNVENIDALWVFDEMIVEVIFKNRCTFTDDLGLD